MLCTLLGVTDRGWFGALWPNQVIDDMRVGTLSAKGAVVSMWTSRRLKLCVHSGLLGVPVCLIATMRLALSAACNALVVTRRRVSLVFESAYCPPTVAHCQLRQNRGMKRRVSDYAK